MLSVEMYSASQVSNPEIGFYFAQMPMGKE